ncbi:MAG: DUF262 domain-containing protein [Streptococcaceae bacterium]|nr:DUF262 domain-containing protein [Streptococcaceae bacterium]
MNVIKYDDEVSIIDILSKSKLNIPEYQRPYKWERKHIRNLFYDIREAIEKDTSVYRIGTVILHQKDDGKLDIVDGQQRLISISLFLLFFDRIFLPSGAESLLNSKQLGTSQISAKQNYNEWTVLLSLIKEDERKEFYDYLMNRCRVSVITMPHENLPEAFQLFDSQNNRGKKLEPHDLLKAYHLRAIGSAANDKTVEKWEQYSAIPNDSESLNLVKLFDKHLFRLRKWTDGETGLSKRKNSNTRDLIFNENFIDDFKGVDINVSLFPYLNLYSLLKENNLDFPSSLSMPIINGEAFFKYIEYSYDLIDGLFYKENIPSNFVSEDISKLITSKISTLSKIINLYNNMIALFVDRFGKGNLNREVCEKVFIWAFYPRTVASRIFDSTQANYAAGAIFQKKPAQKLFQVLNSSTTPTEFISRVDMDLLQNFTSDDILDKFNRKVR